jgi:L-arabinose isomerase
MNRSIKPKVGLLFIGCQRFRKLGADTRDGDYEKRKEKYTENFIHQMEEFAKIAFPGIVYGRDDVDSAIAFFHKEKVECVICSFLSWSEDFSWISFLRDMYEIPLLYFQNALPEKTYDNTYDESDFVQFLADGGLVGGLVGSGSIKRFERNVEVIVDDFDSAKGRIQNFIKAAQTRSILRRSRFGLLPCYNDIMMSTYIDPYNMFAKIGPEVNFISYAHLQKEIEKISDNDAGAYMQELSSLYRVESDVREELFLESARSSIALARIREEFNLDALVLNDVSHELFETIGLRPGFYHPSFNENNAVLVPEGDLGAGTIVYVLKQLTGKHINFAEPFFIEKNSNSFSAGHAGPNDHTDADHAGLVKISRDVRFAKTSYKYAGAPFAWYRISPGLKTFAHFSEINGRYKIVCFTAESLPGENELCSYSHSDFKTDIPVTEIFEQVISVGTTQHFGVVDGDVREQLRIFAKISDFDFHSTGGGDI